MKKSELRQIIKEEIKKHLNEEIATNPKDIEIIADLDAYTSRNYLLDRGNKEEVMERYADKIEKLSPNTPEEKYELLINTIEYHKSDEAENELKRINNEYNNNPLVQYKRIYQRSSNYYSG
jgi:hypothetical protein